MNTVQKSAPTFDDVWRSIQELAQLGKETDRRFQETERQMKERSEETERQMKERSEETERQMKMRSEETERQMKMRSEETERQMKMRSEETERQMKERSEETDRRFQETERQMKIQSEESYRQWKERSEEIDRQMKETSRVIKETGKNIGALGNRLGDFVQEMVRPALIRLFSERQLPVHQVLTNIVAYDDNGQFVMEIDLLAVNTNVAIAVECKSHLSVDDVNEHLERLATFKQHFKQYASCQLLGGVAAMVMPDEVGRYAYRKGLFVMAQSGDTVLIRNDERFQPKTW